MTKAKICKKAPFKTTVEAGKTYFWCSCGYSKNQPFCDGSHRESGTGLKSVKYMAEKDSEVYFCGCKHSQKGALCDGSHNKI